MPQADTQSASAAVRALYEVISGHRGEQRDWQRFRDLFHQHARLIAVQADPAGRVAAKVISPDEYIALNAPLLEREGFFEAEAEAQVEQFGGLLVVKSAYEVRRHPDDAAPLVRGTNVVQLFDDGARWWILSLAWSSR